MSDARYNINPNGHSRFSRDERFSLKNSTSKIKTIIISFPGLNGLPTGISRCDTDSVRVTRGAQKETVSGPVVMREPTSRRAETRCIDIHRETAGSAGRGGPGNIQGHLTLSTKANVAAR